MRFKFMRIKGDSHQGNCKYGMDASPKKKTGLLEKMHLNGEKKKPCNESESNIINDWGCKIKYWPISNRNGCC